ncbi:nucleotide exchange factor GrpE [Candidatus Micrarchaeota archaeon]|nr:nucleotide exchange factor GrpE [Candidatus Micrarchaeota archaeon]
MDEKKKADAKSAENAPEKGKTLGGECGEQSEALAGEVAALNERMLRIAAEYDNFRKRTAKEKEELMLNAKAAMLLKIIPMYEELEMAAKAAEKSVKNANAAESAGENAMGENAIIAGVKMLCTKFSKMLSEEGIVRMQALGKKFDPYLHDVVSHVESEKPLGEIVQIVQDGYNLNGKVLRHAVVIVSNGKKEEKKTEKENEEECDVDACPSC